MATRQTVPLRLVTAPAPTEAPRETFERAKKLMSLRLVAGRPTRVHVGYLLTFPGEAAEIGEENMARFERRITFLCDRLEEIHGFVIGDIAFCSGKRGNPPWAEVQAFMPAYALPNPIRMNYAVE